jgi:rsbT co-antagonist protein RsbR
MGPYMSNKSNRLSTVIAKYETEILQEWIEGQKAGLRHKDLIKDSELAHECTRFQHLLQAALASQSGDNSTNGAAWNAVRDMLAEISESRSQMGFSPAETATFVFSFKKPFIARLNRELSNDSANPAAEIWRANELLDELGLHTMEVFQKRREQIIQRQQQEMLELSTPVVKIWEGVLAVPLIGTLDSTRTQVVMEGLLQEIVNQGAEIAIIDITGVPTVDTLVAQHLMKTVTAARLMGAECIISGIRPQIAQTIVHLGVDLGNIATKASLSEALKLAFQRLGVAVKRVQDSK